MVVVLISLKCWHPLDVGINMSASLTYLPMLDLHLDYPAPSRFLALKQNYDLMVIFSHTPIDFSLLDQVLVDQNPQTMSYSHSSLRFLYYLTVPNHFALMNSRSLVSSNDLVLGVLNLFLVTAILLKRVVETFAQPLRVNPNLSYILSKERSVS